METKRRGSRQAEDSLPTGATLLPVLQVLSLVCLAISGLHILGGGDPLRSAATCYILGMTCVVGVFWVARSHAITGRGRATCSVVVLLLLIGPELLGNFSFAVPILIVATALLVIDVGMYTSLAGGGLTSIVLLVLGLALGRGPADSLSVAVSSMVLMSAGTTLGLVLSRYDAALTQVRRKTALEKEFMLAQERARAAHELHDGLGHRLTQIGMSLEFAGRVRETDPDAAWDEVAVAERTSRDAVNEMRTWVRALSPVRSENDRGGVDLEAIAASFRGTDVDVRVREELDLHVLTDAAELLVYRTVQEGLTNALRHSRARVVEILATRTGDEVLVSVTNEIPATQVRKIPKAPVGDQDGASAGFGINGLSERAVDLGGTVTAGRNGNSFRLTLTLPLREAASTGQDVS